MITAPSLYSTRQINQWLDSRSAAQLTRESKIVVTETEVGDAEVSFSLTVINLHQTRPFRRETRTGSTVPRANSTSRKPFTPPSVRFVDGLESWQAACACSNFERQMRSERGNKTCSSAVVSE